MGESEEIRAAQAPPGARFRCPHVVLWLPLCLVHGSAVAWLAFGLQKHFAPLVLFPALVGATLGVTLVGLMRLVQVAGRTTVLVGAIVACFATVYGQHYFSYLQQRETALEQAAQFRMAARLHPDMVQGTPPEPASGVVEFLRWQAIRGRPIMASVVARGPWAWASWALDGTVTLLAVLLITIPASRQPYCDRCRSWFRTVRQGDLAQALASEMAAEVGIESPDDVRRATYRLVGCRSGCGTSGFELCWELPNGQRKTARLWISADDRTRLEAMVNRAVSPEQ
jgi:hypothetical protein